MRRVMALPSTLAKLVESSDSRNTVSPIASRRRTGSQFSRRPVTRRSPVMIYSDQTMLLREFGARFDALWAQGAGGVGSRSNVMSILRDVMERLENMA